MTEQKIDFESPALLRAIYAHDENNLLLVEKAFNVKIVARDNFLKISGNPENIEKTKKLIENLENAVSDGELIKKEDINYLINIVGSGNDRLKEVYSAKIEVPSRRRYIRPKTSVQKQYIDSIAGNDIVFGIGPAGTGKTYLAMAMAVSALTKNEVSRIILTRPAVEAGENLGFLPGDLYEKVSPYLRPLYDALYDMMEIDRIQKCLERGIIEVAPLAFMRGRTLNDSFVILDEAQNSTREQMKMFLTRLGFDSKTVITGDITQIDLPTDKMSGLIHVQGILKDIEGISFVYFSDTDVVRHELVQKIIKAYLNGGQRDNGAT
ncbi:PhoH family protein [bacterium]|jgi:phosphate starvation-inducible PhoH-like protein|nr:PhoH family protein [bacterium]